MVCNHAAITDIRSNYVNSNINWFNRRDCDVNPGEHERLTNDVIDGLAEESRYEVLQRIFDLEKIGEE